MTKKPSSSPVTKLLRIAVQRPSRLGAAPLLLWGLSVSVSTPRAARADDAPASPTPAPLPGSATSTGTGLDLPAPSGAELTLPSLSNMSVQGLTNLQGLLPAQGFDPNAHLPSSSRARSDIGAGDTFDIGRDGGASFRGNADGAYVTEAAGLPETHTVRRGDTLWDIAGQYYRNPYAWPRLWAHNPQVQNPHWIYPGDRMQLRGEEGAGLWAGSGPLGPVGSTGDGATPGVFNLKRSRSVEAGTVFLREVGWIGDVESATWGEIAGSEGERSILGDDSEVYVQLEDDRQVKVGDELTIFRSIREVESSENDDAEGTLVSVRGTMRVDRYNARTHMAQGRITECLDVIERGFKVGPVGRRFEVVPPRKNDKDVEARILTSLYPHQFWGQEQVLFLDKGEKEGVKQGNRFFAVMRGDRWRQSLPTTGKLATVTPIIDDDAFARTERIEVDADTRLFPDETYAEVRVISVREHTSMAIVIGSKRELERDSVLFARKGY